MARKNWIDTEVNIEGSRPQVRRGVKFGLGDGTVPLLSLGAMCVRGWKDDRWNPARIPVITHEFKHEPEGLDLRGGARSGKAPYDSNAKNATSDGPGYDSGPHRYLG